MLSRRGKPSPPRGPREEEQSAAPSDAPFVTRAHRWLCQPVHGSTLGLFRLAFGLCMSAQRRHFAQMYEELASSKAVFPYPALDLWTPVSPAGGSWILFLNACAAWLTTFGLCTRLATPLLCATFTCLFLNCVSFHNNHYILICHVTFVASFTSWGRWGSVDALLDRFVRGQREVRTVPYWHLLAFQFLFSVPYTFGAIAKLNEDWLLRAQPLKMWLHPHGRRMKIFPSFIREAWCFPWAISWGGVLFDAGIVPVLFSRPLRLAVGFPGALAFNGMNKLMFGIGVFPYAMLGSLLLFLEPCFFARALQCALGADAGAPLAGYRAPRWHRWWFVPLSPARAACVDVERGSALPPAGLPQPTAALPTHSLAASRRRIRWRHLAPVGFVGAMFTFHILYPLRRFVLYPSGVSWHEEGHLAAWHMKLRSKHGWVFLLAEQVAARSGVRRDEVASCGLHAPVELVGTLVGLRGAQADGSVGLFSPEADDLLTAAQARKVATLPHTLLRYAAHLTRLHLEANRSLVALRASSCFSLNARAAAPLYAPPAVNLLALLGSYEWAWRSAVGEWLTPLPPVDPPAACDLSPPSSDHLLFLAANYSSSRRAVPASALSPCEASARLVRAQARQPHAPPRLLPKRDASEPT
ncbi:hypothetical protein AB1Y20_019724 [Prymnesium parvum]|uniref:HTTM-like domain-containing protein n=1 Tax=Prymnesium parvum TaxID=97485 RepID=A0AB34JWQ8_PRYPA